MLDTSELYLTLTRELVGKGLKLTVRPASPGAGQGKAAASVAREGQYSLTVKYHDDPCVAAVMAMTYVLRELPDEAQPENQ